MKNYKKIPQNCLILATDWPRGEIWTPVEKIIFHIFIILPNTSSLLNLCPYCFHITQDTSPFMFSPHKSLTELLGPKRLKTVVTFSPLCKITSLKWKSFVENFDLSQDRNTSVHFMFAKCRLPKSYVKIWHVYFYLDIWAGNFSRYVVL